MIKAWEKKHNQKFNKSKLIYHMRLSNLNLDKELERRRWQDIISRSQWDANPTQVVFNPDKLDY